jgi:hypothetical protein
MQLPWMKKVPPSSEGGGPGTASWDIGMSPRALKDEAMRATGLSDFGESVVHANGLEMLTQSLREAARLSMLGSFAMKRHILHALKQRLLLENLRKTEPERFAAPLLPPIIITGLPRSGTTVIHRLLAQHDRLRAPLMRELLNLVPSPSRLHRGVDEIYAQVSLAVLRFYGRLDTKHVMRLNEPDECMIALAMTFHSIYYWLIAPCYRYLEWYGQANRTPKYREYRAMLSLLQARAPGRRLVLKAPEHLGSVDELLAEIPEALIVVCYRRPEDAIASHNSLIHPIHRLVSKSVDPERSGEAWLAFCVNETRRYMSMRERSRPRIIEVAYDDIVQSPLAVVTRILERAGLPLGAAEQAKFEQFIARNPKDKHGHHVYRPEDFGQTAEDIARRMAHYRMAESSS